MFIHRLRRFTAAEEQELHGHTCAFNHDSDCFSPLAHWKVFGTDTGHRVTNFCCCRHAQEFSRMLQQRFATPVTHGEPDDSYDGRPNYLSAFTLSHLYKENR